jgi:GNAT superfamily N-acetyltransferase
MTQDILPCLRESSILVMQDENDIIEFAGHKASYISWVYVDPTHRRRGVATALVRQMRHVECRQKQSCRRALHQRLGVVIEKEFAGDFNGHAIDVMTLWHEAS